MSAQELFARNMRTLRVSKGLQQQEMVDDLASLGIRFHNSTISKIEAGVRVIRLGEAVAIARVLGSTVDEMMQMEDA